MVIRTTIALQQTCNVTSSTICCSYYRTFSHLSINKQSFEDELTYLDQHDEFFKRCFDERFGVNNLWYDNETRVTLHRTLHYYTFTIVTPRRDSSVRFASYALSLHSLWTTHNTEPCRAFTELENRRTRRKSVLVVSKGENNKLKSHVILDQDRTQDHSGDGPAVNHCVTHASIDGIRSQ